MTTIRTWSEFAICQASIARGKRQKITNIVMIILMILLLLRTVDNL